MFALALALELGVPKHGTQTGQDCHCQPIETRYAALIQVQGQDHGGLKCAKMADFKLQRLSPPLI